jgi:hypothetical protein
MKYSIRPLVCTLVDLYIYIYIHEKKRKKENKDKKKDQENFGTQTAIVALSTGAPSQNQLQQL